MMNDTEMLVDEGLEILDEEECRRLLASGYLGRLGVTIHALPAIFPVNYRLIGEAIYFRTGPGTKLNHAANGQVVAFQVDGGIDRAYRQGWSVLVLGRGEEVDDFGELQALAHLLPTPWAPGPRARVVRIPIEIISGRRIVQDW